MSDASTDQERLREFDRTFPQLLELLLGVAKEWGIDPVPTDMDRGIIYAYTQVWDCNRGADLWLPGVFDGEQGRRVEPDTEIKPRFGLVMGDRVLSSAGNLTIAEFKAYLIKQSEIQFADLLRSRSGLWVEVSHGRSVSASPPPADDGSLVEYLQLLISQANAADLDQSTESAAGSAKPSRL